MTLELFCRGAARRISVALRRYAPLALANEILRLGLRPIFRASFDENDIDFQNAFLGCGMSVLYLNLFHDKPN
jgi:hypothetical protein